MTEEVKEGSEGAGFSVIDPKLTVFALANGMDLSKGPDYRRLEWFTEGLERAILIRAIEASVFSLTVMSWKTGNADAREERPAHDGVAPDQLSGALTDAIEAANGLGAPPG